ncbi:MAG TPA: malto-oligosyltrehalose trehalohydrolase, partial [Sandaracinaceae bacterium LLY-WYZ-13_1]|nr:malto-oligosyltrehalose trehalohydrolase [Sandaracinaceae bacterium LLY-WYZ-13_1]
LGATVADGGVDFAVWAPTHDRVTVRVQGGEALALEKGDDGIHRGRAGGVGAGARYRVSLDDGPPFPDPASRFQPDGVHGPSEVVDPGTYRWAAEGWGGLDPRRMVLYELHVGTFTEEGTFDALRAYLPYLAELGVTAVELMPVHDFPGERGWGYDPAALFAPCRAYGRPDDLRRLVDEAHSLGLGVVLDVVYNHLGPDGAYWAAFGPVLTGRHRTPWGRAVNLDDTHARGVRDTILLNAIRWLTEYRIDALRLDATFALVDDSPEHLLAEMARRVEALPGPARRLIAEDDRNLADLVRPRGDGGYGLDGVWADDFHHLMRRYLAGDRHGYFAEFPTSTEAVAECIEERWYRRGRPGDSRGTSAAGLPHERFVTCIQNHDQIGNRPTGDRLHHTVPMAAVRAATAVHLFAPQTPLLFMGQEWAASAPFLYFTDHGPELGAKVRRGRKREFRDFPGFSGDVPDPQAEETFERSKLDLAERERSPHRETLALHRALIALRGRVAGAVRAESPREGLLRVERGRHVLVASLGGEGPVAVPRDVEIELCTEDARFGGGGGVAHEPGEVRFLGPGATILRRTVEPTEAG